MCVECLCVSVRLDGVCAENVLERLFWCVYVRASTYFFTKKLVISRVVLCRFFAVLAKLSHDF